jgi:hypothetical protein
MVEGHQILPGSRNQSPDARVKPVYNDQALVVSRGFGRK